MAKAALKRRGWVGLGLIVLCLNPSVQAATYYVRTGGSNSHSCTQAQTDTDGTAKQTIGAGMDCMSTGDILLIRGGTYDETLDANNQRYPGGTSWGNAPQIKGSPGDPPIIRPSGDWGPGSFNAANPGLVQYLIFDHLIFDGSRIVGRGDGAFSINGASHIRLQNSELRNLRYSKGAAIHFSKTQGLPQFNELINLKVHDNGTLACCLSGEVGHGIYGSAHDSLFDGIESYGNGGWGMQLYSADGGVDNNIVRNSTFHDNGQVVASSGGLFVGSGEGNKIYNNVIYHEHNYALMLDSGPRETALYHNTVAENQGDGLYVGSGSGTVIENNILYNNGGSNYTIAGGRVTSSHNLCNAGCGESPRTGNPDFRGAVDFHLSAGSAAIDAGMMVGEVTTDADGHPRPQGAGMDIGAYEAGNGTSKPPEKRKPPAPRNFRITTK